MKKCGYCGCDNEDSATWCRGCGGTELRAVSGTGSPVVGSQPKTGVGQWFLAMFLLFVYGMALVLAALGTQFVLHLPGLAGYRQAMGLAVLVPLPLWMLLSSLLVAPLMRLLGMLKYYSPLFVVTGSQSRVYLHGATLYDYALHLRWRERGVEARLKTLIWYVEGLLGLIRDIQSGAVPATAKITGTSYFFSPHRAQWFGFRVEESWQFALGGILTYPTQLLTYSFAKGRLAFPNVFRAKRASITGARLLEQKTKLEALLERLKDRRQPRLAWGPKLGENCTEEMVK
ncbi:MAG TPA: hypothetical protein VEC99_06965 [Clostridia bacterium]|nr:hypothetical protein [Clostridia bacterium]